MKTDLKSMSRKELEKLKSDVDKALAKVSQREKTVALAAAEKAVKVHGFTLAEITGENPAAKSRAKPVKPSKPPSAPKYVNPDDKAKTWTGKGRQPEWFKAALAAGKTPNDMEL